MSNAARPIEVLLIEDNPGDVLLVRQALSVGPTPTRVRVALDGEQALRIIAGEDFHADVVILDLNIPKLSGFSLLQRIQPATPVVIFTSSSRPSDRERSLELGASEFVQKPHDLDEYRRVVVNIIRTWAGRSIARTVD